MMKIKTSEATPLQLNWLVAKCERAGVTGIDSEGDIRIAGNSKYTPTTDWAQGGPIIERKKITLRIWDDEDYVHAYIDTGKDWFEGPTPLIAAMRCYVSSELGDEVAVPEEIV
jgi:hypothetical protein